MDFIRPDDFHSIELPGVELAHSLDDQPDLFDISIAEQTIDAIIGLSKVLTPGTVGSLLDGGVNLDVLVLGQTIVGEAVDYGVKITVQFAKTDREKRDDI